MKLVFLSNLLTPHQELICDKFYEMLGQDFIFIETISRNVELPKGWKPSAKQHDYLINHGGNNEAYILKIVNDAGVVIYGSAPEKFIYTRIKMGNLLLSIRNVYIEKFNWWEQPLRSLKNYFRGWSKKKSLFIMCQRICLCGLSENF